MTDLLKTSAVKFSFSAAVTALTVYFDKLILPLAVLILVMAADYITGMIKAWVNSDFSSKTGLRGIVKKLSYLMLVACAACTDYLISLGFGDKADFDGMCIALIVCVWLIINELISILENLDTIGVPVPEFMNKLVQKLRQNSEDKNSSD